MANANVSHLIRSKSVAGAVTRHRGFTAIEVLIAIAISTVIGLVISQSLLKGWQAQISQEAYSDLQRAGRFTLDEMTGQIWNATTVVSGTTINGTVYTSGAETIVLHLEPLDADGDILSGDDYLVFRKNGSRIERLVGAAGASKRADWQTPLSLNQEVSALTLRYYDAAGTELVPGSGDLTTARKITVSVTSSRTQGSRTISRPLEATAILRNKGT